VVGAEGRIDVAPLRGASILEDLAQRDFTVNAMAVTVGGTEVLDPFGGRLHLRERRLVKVSDGIFRDDPLRMMRAARFHQMLGLELGADLVDDIRHEARLLAATAVERVVMELALTFSVPRAADAVELWLRLGVLEQFLPEVVREGRAIAALPVLRALDDILERPGAWFPETAPALIGRLAGPLDGALDRTAGLRLAGLLHAVSTEEAVQLTRRLKLSGEAGSLLSAVARREACAPSLAAARGREAILFLWNSAPWEPEVILVETAKTSARGESRALGEAGPEVDALRGLLQLWCDRDRHGVSRPPVDGTSLMEELGLESGPLLGAVLREARLAWEAKEAGDKEAVMAVARAALVRATAS
jgi:hypothetical protein